MEGLHRNKRMTPATLQNIVRKSAFVDQVQYFKDSYPMFSWIDINVTELCNRKCVFCPRVDEDLYPNQRLYISTDLINKIAQELKDINYQGAVVFSGYGEPTLHPQLSELIQILSPIRVELVTNGDTLTVDSIKEYYTRGLSYMCVSLYDGPEQVGRFEQMFHSAGIGKDHYILRDRWHSEDQSFGLTLTNRAGTLQLGPAPSVRPCYYLAYSMCIDWNGDALLCVQDWEKRLKYGNLYTDTLESVWRSSRYSRQRQQLISGKRTNSPCSKCNAQGTVHGTNHSLAFSNLK